MDVRIFEETRQAPPDGSTLWSTRKVACTGIRRITRRPSRWMKRRRFTRSTAWIRRPLSTGGAGRHGFEFYRHGTLSLFAALNTKSGEMLGRAVPRHTRQRRLGGVSRRDRQKGRAIHVIADNLSTHNTQAVRTNHNPLPSNTPIESASFASRVGACLPARSGFHCSHPRRQTEFGRSPPAQKKVTLRISRFST